MNARRARQIRYGIVKARHDLPNMYAAPPTNGLAAAAYYRTWHKATAAKTILKLKDNK